MDRVAGVGVHVVQGPKYWSIFIIFFLPRAPKCASWHFVDTIKSFKTLIHFKLPLLPSVVLFGASALLYKLKIKFPNV